MRFFLAWARHSANPRLAAVTILDDRFDYGESRFITLGLLSGRVSLARVA